MALGGCLAHCSDAHPGGGLLGPCWVWLLLGVASAGLGDVSSQGWHLR